LLRMPMSVCSRIVYFITNVPPHERQHKAHKRKSIMKNVSLSEDSTDIWTKSIIQKYEERPQDLDFVVHAGTNEKHTQES
jgi:hypothetical protein